MVSCSEKLLRLLAPMQRWTIVDEECDFEGEAWDSRWRWHGWWQVARPNFSPSRRTMICDMMVVLAYGKRAWRQRWGLSELSSCCRRWELRRGGRRNVYHKGLGHGDCLGSRWVKRRRRLKRHTESFMAARCCLVMPFGSYKNMSVAVGDAESITTTRCGFLDGDANVSQILRWRFVFCVLVWVLFVNWKYWFFFCLNYFLNLKISGFQFLGCWVK